MHKNFVQNEFKKKLKKKISWKQLEEKLFFKENSFHGAKIKKNPKKIEQKLQKKTFC